MAFETEIEAKRKELNYLKHVSALTQKLKAQLDELSVQVAQMNSNAVTVKDVMANWDSVLRSISQASISLLQYTENDYETGKWASKEEHRNQPDTEDESAASEISEDNQQGQQDQLPPLPETLVRVKVADEVE